jgi:hypothetical protein
VQADERRDLFATNLVAALTAPVQAGDAGRQITAVAVDLLPHVDFASICLRAAGQPVRIVAPTNPRVLEADRLQHELSEGPCLDVIDSLQAVRSTDVAKDPRWPLYGPKVAASGIAAQTTLPLVGAGSMRACVNLYSLTTGFTGGEPAGTDLFATHASVALGFALQMRDLGEAMDRRKVIGQAIGIVMERYAINEEAAFAFLTRASQTANVKLRHIAEQIVTAVDERAQRG